MQAKRVVKRLHQLIGQSTELLADALGGKGADLLGLGLRILRQTTGPYRANDHVRPAPIDD